MLPSVINSDASSYCSSWSEEFIDILLDKVLKMIIKIVQNYSLVVSLIANKCFVTKILFCLW